MDYEKFFWQQRELEKTLASLKPILLQSDVFSQAVLSPMKDLELLANRFTFPPEYLSQYEILSKSVDQIVSGSTFPLLAELDHTTIDSIMSVQNTMTRLIEDNVLPDFNKVAEINSRISSSLLPAEALLQTGFANDTYALAMLESQRAFSEFTEARLALLNEQSKVFRGNTLDVITVSAEILDSMNRGLENASLVFAHSEAFSEALKIEVFDQYNNRIDTEVDLEDESSVEEFLSKLPLNEICELGSDIIEMVLNLNTEAEREGRKPIFKQTTETMRACYILSTTVAEDEASFGEVVKALYFLFYEGTGEADRLLAITTDDNLEPLWTVKHLRLGFSHDVNHGKPGKVKKAHTDIGNAYKSLIGNVMPRSREDWCSAQHELYHRLHQSLEVIWYS